MRTLYLVGLTQDRHGLVLSDREDGSGANFVVGVDRPDARKLLAAALRTGRVPTASRPAQGEKAPRSGLPPREIQALLRAGRTVAEVAVEAQATEEHILRWSAPVAHEQDAALRRALAARLDAGRRGPSALPLGRSVDANVRARGGDGFDGDDGWSAYLEADGTWVVRFRSEPGGPSRRKAGDAEWTVDPASGVVAARNRAGAALGWVGPDGPRPRRVAAARPAGPAPVADPGPVADPVPVADPAPEVDPAVQGSLPVLPAGAEPSRPPAS